MIPFDPENVERWGDSGSEEHHMWLEVVAAEDYDKLLALYRECLHEMRADG